MSFKKESLSASVICDKAKPRFYFASCPCTKMLFVFAIVLSVGLASSRPNDKAIANIDPSKYCACSEEELPQCGCCVDLQELISENYTVCANLTYVEAQYGVRLTVTVNGEVLFNETLSGKNPPPLCQGVIGVADFCVKLYNMSYEQGKFGGCLEMYADFVERVLDLKLGCYYMEGGVGDPVAENEVLGVPVDEKARFHSLFQISNSVKEQILDEMHKWSYEDGDLSATRGLHKHRLPEPVVEEYEDEKIE